MQPLAALGATRSRQGAGEAPSAPLPSISAFIPAARALPAAGRRRPERRSAGGEAERGGEQLPAPASEAGLGADPSGSASRAPPLNNAPPRARFGPFSPLPSAPQPPSRAPRPRPTSGSPRAAPRTQPPARPGPAAALRRAPQRACAGRGGKGRAASAGPGSPQHRSVPPPAEGALQ